MSEWTCDLLSYPDIFAYLRIVYLFWRAFFKSSIKPSHFFMQQVKSAKTRRKVGFTSSRFSFNLLLIQCFLNSLFLVLILDRSHVGCSSLLAKDFELSLVFVGWKNVIKGLYFLPLQAQPDFWQSWWEAWKIGCSRCKSKREVLACMKLNCRHFITWFLCGWLKWMH